MKKIKVQLFICSLLMVAFSFTSCKSKSNADTNTPAATVDTTVVAAPAPAPVEISGDDELKRGVTDATKDYTTVKADVTNGVINLSGEIKRADWQKLNPTLNSLHPKSINSDNLTIK